MPETEMKLVANSEPSTESIEPASSPSPAQRLGEVRALVAQLADDKDSLDRLTNLALLQLARFDPEYVRSMYERGELANSLENPLHVLVAMVSRLPKEMQAKTVLQAISSTSFGDDFAEASVAMFVIDLGIGTECISLLIQNGFLTPKDLFRAIPYVKGRERRMEVIRGIDEACQALDAEHPDLVEEMRHDLHKALGSFEGLSTAERVLDWCSYIATRGESQREAAYRALCSEPVARENVATLLFTRFVEEEDLLAPASGVSALLQFIALHEPSQEGGFKSAGGDFWPVLCRAASMVQRAPAAIRSLQPSSSDIINRLLPEATEFDRARFQLVAIEARDRALLWRQARFPLFAELSGVPVQRSFEELTRAIKDLATAGGGADYYRTFTNLSSVTPTMQGFLLVAQYLRNFGESSRRSLARMLRAFPDGVISQAVMAAAPDKLMGQVREEYDHSCLKILRYSEQRESILSRVIDLIGAGIDDGEIEQTERERIVRVAANISKELEWSIGIAGRYIGDGAPVRSVLNSGWDRLCTASNDLLSASPATAMDLDTRNFLCALVEYQYTALIENPERKSLTFPAVPLLAAMRAPVARSSALPPVDPSLAEDIPAIFRHLVKNCRKQEDRSARSEGAPSPKTTPTQFARQLSIDGTLIDRSLKSLRPAGYIDCRLVTESPCLIEGYLTTYVPEEGIYTASAVIGSAGNPLIGGVSLSDFLKAASKGEVKAATYFTAGYFSPPAEAVIGTPRFAQLDLESSGCKIVADGSTRYGAGKKDAELRLLSEERRRPAGSTPIELAWEAIPQHLRDQFRNLRYLADQLPVSVKEAISSALKVSTVEGRISIILRAVGAQYRYVLTANQDPRARATFASEVEPGCDILMKAIHSVGRTDEFEGAWKCDGLNHIGVVALQSADVPALMTVGRVASKESFPGFVEISGERHAWSTAIAIDHLGHAVAVECDVVNYTQRISRAELTRAPLSKSRQVGAGNEAQFVIPHPNGDVFSSTIHLPTEFSTLTTDDYAQVDVPRVLAALESALADAGYGPGEQFQVGVETLLTRVGKHLALGGVLGDLEHSLSPIEVRYLRESTAYWAKHWGDFFREIDEMEKSLSA